MSVEYTQTYPFIWKSIDVWAPLDKIEALIFSLEDVCSISQSKPEILQDVLTYMFLVKLTNDMSILSRQ